MIVWPQVEGIVALLDRVLRKCLGKVIVLTEGLLTMAGKTLKKKRSVKSSWVHNPFKRGLHAPRSGVNEGQVLLHIRGNRVGVCCIDGEAGIWVQGRTVVGIE